MRDGAIECAGPALHLSGVGVDSIKTRLRVGVLPFHRADFSLEENALAIARPAQRILLRLVAGELPGSARGRRSGEIDTKDFEFGNLLLTFGDRCGDERDATPIRRGDHLFHPPGTLSDWLRAGRYVGVSIRLLVRIHSGVLMTRDSIGNAHGKYGVTALGGAIQTSLIWQTLGS